MHHVEHMIEVDRPVSTVYNQWTQFQDFPAFMSGVEDAQQLDDNHVQWKANVWGLEKEWEAEITEQEPDRRISWKSVSGAHNAGTVRFKPVGKDRTEVRLVMAVDPETTAERLGAAMGVLSVRVKESLRDFKKFIERQDAPTGAWRGEVVDSVPHRRPFVHPAKGWPMSN